MPRAGVSLIADASSGGSRAQALLGGKFRHPLVNHDDAGGEPDHEDETEDEAEVPMDDDERRDEPFHGESLNSINHPASFSTYARS